MLWGSKMILQLGAMGIRSPLARVRVLLSSSTEFKFSIQIASTGPSSTNQMCSPIRDTGKFVSHKKLSLFPPFPSPSLDVLEELPFLALRVLLHRVEKIPSVQSLVATSSRPNIWGAVIALGFILSSLWGSPQSVIAFIRIWIQQVFPAPLGPRVIIP